jgi:hypothetical protein
MSQNRGHRRIIHPPGDNVSVDSHGGDDDAGWGKRLTRLPELSGSPTSRDMWKQLGRSGRKSENFAYLLSKTRRRT